MPFANTPKVSGFAGKELRRTITSSPAQEQMTVHKTYSPSASDVENNRNETQQLLDDTHAELAHQLAYEQERAQHLKMDNERTKQHTSNLKAELYRSQNECERLLETLYSLQLKYSEEKEFAARVSAQAELLQTELDVLTMEHSKVKADVDEQLTAFDESLIHQTLLKDMCEHHKSLESQLGSMWFAVALECNRRLVEANCRMQRMVEVTAVKSQIFQLGESAQRDAVARKQSQEFACISQQFCSGFQRVFRLVHSREVAIMRCEAIRAAVKHRPQPQMPSTPCAASAPAQSTTTHSLPSPRAPFILGNSRTSVPAQSHTPPPASRSSSRASNQPTVPRAVSQSSAEQDAIVLARQFRERVDRIDHAEISERCAVELAARVAWGALMDLERRRRFCLVTQHMEVVARDTVRKQWGDEWRAIHSEYVNEGRIHAIFRQQFNEIARVFRSGETASRIAIQQHEEDTYNSMAFIFSRSIGDLYFRETTSKCEELSRREHSARHRIEYAAMSYLNTFLHGVSTVTLVAHREPSARYVVQYESNKRFEQIRDEFFGEMRMKVSATYIMECRNYNNRCFEGFMCSDILVEALVANEYASRNRLEASTLAYMNIYVRELAIVMLVAHREPAGRFLLQQSAKKELEHLRIVFMREHRECTANSLLSEHCQFCEAALKLCEATVFSIMSQAGSALQNQHFKERFVSLLGNEERQRSIIDYEAMSCMSSLIAKSRTYYLKMFAEPHCRYRVEEEEQHQRRTLLSRNRSSLSSGGYTCARPSLTPQSFSQDVHKLHHNLECALAAQITAFECSPFDMSLTEEEIYGGGEMDTTESYKTLSPSPRARRIPIHSDLHSLEIFLRECNGKTG